MIKRRSFLLLVSFSAIILYLNYKSIFTKDQKNVNILEKMSPESVLNTLNQLTEYSMNWSGRRLLQIREEFPDNDSGNILKSVIVYADKSQIKRNNFSDWEFHGNATPIENENTLESEFSETKHAKTGKNQSLIMAEYNNKNEPKGTLKFKRDITLKTGNNTKFNSVMDTRLLSVIEKKIPINSKRDPKFLSALFNRDGNKENPPLELGSGEISGNREFQTEIMQDISFISENFDTNDHKVKDDSEVTQELSVINEFKVKDLEPTMINMSNSLASNSDDQNISILERIDVPNCENCILSESILSEKSVNSEHISSHKTETVIELSTGSFQMAEFCINLVNDFKKSSKNSQLSETGSSNFVEENSMKDSTETTGQQTETSIKVTDTVELKAPNGILQSVWNSITSLGFRNERKLTENLSTTTQSNANQKMLLNSFLTESDRFRLNENFENLNKLTKISINECKIFLMNSGFETTTPKADINKNLRFEPYVITSIPFKVHRKSTSLVKISDAKIPVQIESLEKTLDSALNKEHSTENILNQPSNGDFSVTDLQERFSNFNEGLTTESITGLSELSDISGIKHVRDIKVNTDSNMVTKLKNSDEFSKLKNVLDNSGDERSFFGNLFGSGERELDERRFFGSGERELNERRFFGSLFGSGERELDERRFFGSLFGSGERELDGRRFFGSLFGSGERELDERRFLGSLFGSGEGELKMSNINKDTDALLSGEERTIPNFSVEGSGLRDVLEIDDGLNEENKDRTFGSFNFGSGERSLNEKEIGTEINKLPMSDKSLQPPDAEHSLNINRAQSSLRGARANDFFPTDWDQAFSSEFSTTSNISDSETNNELHITVTSASIVNSSSSVSDNIEKTYSNINPKAKTSVKIFCISTTECNASLNERCVLKEDRLICDCPKGFVRNPEDLICKTAAVLQTFLILPGEEFHKDLKNINSKLYLKKRKEAIETMWLLLQSNPKLSNLIAEIEVNEFEKGSLIVNYNLKIINEKDIMAGIGQQIENQLKDLFENVPRDITLNLQNASIATFVINPCSKSELNYCHKDADCVGEKNHTSFRCRCKDGYLDISESKIYPGEICTVHCDTNYCGENHHCQLTVDGRKQCICSGWYFGERCHLSGIVIVISFIAANVVVAVAVVVILHICKRRRRHYNRNLSHFHPIPSTSAPPQIVADSIVLDDLNSKVSNCVSTNLCEQNAPIIYITSPSIPGSSYDYDSTFDKSCSSDGSRSDCGSNKNV